MIGERLKELRVARNLSLREVARRSGLSATMISQVERDVTHPSLSTLRKLSAVFGESMASVFSEGPAPGAAEDREVLVPANSDGSSVWISRPGERLTISEPGSDFSYERLARGNGRLEVLAARIEPGSASSAQAWSHPSVECVYVIVGSITARIGDRDHVLNAGEALTFDAREPHLYRNNGTEIAEVILSITPPMP
jgi:transcriptional regulator with XRE-family HTH domain